MDYRALDLADFAEARALEASAERLLPVVISSQKTRGPRQEALRQLAREEGFEPARVLLAKADAAYWRVIVRHGPIVSRIALQLARRTPRMRDDLDGLKQLVRIGWFRAALRFEPDRGLAFPSYAKSWGVAAVQVANDREADVPRGRNRDARADRGGWAIVGTVGVDGDADHRFESFFTDTISVSPDDAVVHVQQVERVTRAVSSLGACEQTVMVGRWRGETLSQLAVRLMLSKERVRQIERDAVGKIRARVA